MPCSERPGTMVPVVCLLLLASSPYLLDTCGGQSPGPGGPTWWFEDHDLRILIEVEPLPFPMVDHPVELEVNFTELLSDPNLLVDTRSMVLVESTGPTGADSLIRQRDSADLVLEYLVPYRFYPAHMFNEKTNARGTFSWILDGTTTSNRYFHLYFEDIREELAPIPDLSQECTDIDGQYWVHKGTDFFGYNPGEQHDWDQKEAIEILGIHQGTEVEVIDITNRTMHPTLHTTRVDRGQLERIQVPDGTYFKIVADRPVLASISSAYQGGGSAKTFYPSIDRNLVGREFLLAPYRMSEWQGTEHLVNIYAFEDAVIDIKGIGVTYSKRIELARGGYQRVKGLENGQVYEVRSTGDLAIEHESINSFTAAPSSTGSPVGKLFYTSIQSFDGEGMVIFSYENATYTITELDTGDTVHTKTITGMGAENLGEFDSGPMVIKSTGNISVLAGSTEGGADFMNLGDDIAFTGGLGGRTILTYSLGNPGPGPKDDQYPTPPPSGIVFSFKDDTWVNVEGTFHEMGADQWLALEKGFHSLRSDNPITVMTLGRGYQGSSEHRWNDWGTYLAGRLRSPEAKVELQVLHSGIDLSPHPSEGTTTDTMVHAVEPGSSTTFIINVENTGTLSGTFEFYTGGDLLPNWTIIMETNQFHLLSEEVRPFELTVEVPGDAQGQTLVNISFHGRNVDIIEEHDVVFCEVYVDPFYFPDIHGDYVKYVDPGGTATFDLNVTNKGNAQDDIALEIMSSMPTGWGGALTMSQAALSVDENITFQLLVTAPASALAYDELVVDVRATSMGNSSRIDLYRTRTIVLQTYGLNASAGGPVQVRPGNVAVVNITVKNLGNGNDRVMLSVGGLREGWRQTHRGSITLAPCSSQTVKLELSVPGWDETLGLWTEPPGDVPIDVVLVDEIGIREQLEPVVHVLQVRSVDLGAPEDDTTVMFEEDAVIGLVLRNPGNGQDTYTMGSEADVRFDRRSVSLGPGSTTTVNCTVPHSKERPQVLVFTVSARSEGNMTDEVQLTVRTMRERHGSTIGDLSCLWTVLVALAIFAAVEIGLTWREQRLRGRGP